MLTSRIFDNIRFTFNSIVGKGILQCSFCKRMLSNCKANKDRRVSRKACTKDTTSCLQSSLLVLQSRYFRGFAEENCVQLVAGRNTDSTKHAYWNQEIFLVASQYQETNGSIIYMYIYHTLTSYLCRIYWHQILHLTFEDQTVLIKQTVMLVWTRFKVNAYICSWAISDQDNIYPKEKDS